MLTAHRVVREEPIRRSYGFSVCPASVRTPEGQLNGSPTADHCRIRPAEDQYAVESIVCLLCCRVHGLTDSDGQYSNDR